MTSVAPRTPKSRQLSLPPRADTPLTPWTLTRDDIAFLKATQIDPETD